MELFGKQREIQKLEDESLRYLKRIRTLHLDETEIRELESCIYENNCKIRELEKEIEPG